MKFYDWKMDAIRDGRGFHVDVGALSTPITGGGNGDVVDQDQPEAVISVPNGTCIIPIRLAVVCQTPLIASDSDESEIVVAVDIAAAAAGGTKTSETALKMNVGHSRTSECTCTSAYTANMTNPTLGMELAHAVKVGDVQGTAANALWGDLSLLYEPKSPPILNGPCALYVYWGGTVATTGFAQIEWLEYPENYLT